MSLETRRSMPFKQGEEYKLRANHTTPTTPTNGTCRRLSTLKTMNFI
jgi:hypothetical protein